MQPGDLAKLIEAMASLLGVLAWPAVAVVTLMLLGPSLRDFLSTLSEVRLKGGGFEAAATRRLNFDAMGQKLYDFWKPGGGTPDRANARKISACMKDLGIIGSVPWLINAGTAEDRARVAARLGLIS